MLYAVIFTLLVAIVNAAPIPDGGSAYTGAGGSAVGGNNNEYANSQGGGLGNNGDVLNAFSGNAGDGGKANSGTAVGGDGHSGYVTRDRSCVVREADSCRSFWDGNRWTPGNSNGGNAYTGVGGNSNGGSK